MQPSAIPACSEGDSAERQLELDEPRRPPGRYRTFQQESSAAVVMVRLPEGFKALAGGAELRGHTCLLSCHPVTPQLWRGEHAPLHAAATLRVVVVALYDPLDEFDVCVQSASVAHSAASSLADAPTGDGAGRATTEESPPAAASVAGTFSTRVVYHTRLAQLRATLERRLPALALPARGVPVRCRAPAGWVACGGGAESSEALLATRPIAAAATVAAAASDVPAAALSGASDSADAGGAAAAEPVVPEEADGWEAVARAGASASAYVVAIRRRTTAAAKDADPPTPITVMLPTNGFWGVDLGGSVGDMRYRFGAAPSTTRVALSLSQPALAVERVHRWKAPPQAWQDYRTPLSTEERSDQSNTFCHSTKRA